MFKLSISKMCWMRFFSNFSNKFHWHLDLLSYWTMILNMIWHVLRKVATCYFVPLPRLSYIYWPIYFNALNIFAKKLHRRSGADIGYLKSVNWRTFHSTDITICVYKLLQTSAYWETVITNIEGSIIPSV